MKRPDGFQQSRLTENLTRPKQDGDRGGKAPSPSPPRTPARNGPSPSSSRPTSAARTRPVGKQDAGRNIDRKPSPKSSPTNSQGPTLRRSPSGRGGAFAVGKGGGRRSLEHPPVTRQWQKTPVPVDKVPTRPVPSSPTQSVELGGANCPAPPSATAMALSSSVRPMHGMMSMQDSDATSPGSMLGRSSMLSNASQRMKMGSSDLGVALPLAAPPPEAVVSDSSSAPSARDLGGATRQVLRDLLQRAHIVEDLLREAANDVDSSDDSSDTDDLDDEPGPRKQEQAGVMDVLLLHSELVQVSCDLDAALQQKTALEQQLKEYDRQIQDLHHENGSSTVIQEKVGEECQQAEVVDAIVAQRPQSTPVVVPPHFRGATLPAELGHCVDPMGSTRSGAGASFTDASCDSGWADNGNATLLGTAALGDVPSTGDEDSGAPGAVPSSVGSQRSSLGMMYVPPPLKQQPRVPFDVAQAAEAAVQRSSGNRPKAGFKATVAETPPLHGEDSTECGAQSLARSLGGSGSYPVGGSAPTAASPWQACRVPGTTHYGTHIRQVSGGPLQATPKTYVWPPSPGYIREPAVSSSCIMPTTTPEDRTPGSLSILAPSSPQYFPHHQAQRCPSAPASLLLGDMASRDMSPVSVVATQQDWAGSMGLTYQDSPVRTAPQPWIQQVLPPRTLLPLPVPVRSSSVGAPAAIPCAGHSPYRHTPMVGSPMFLPNRAETARGLHRARHVIRRRAKTASPVRSPSGPFLWNPDGVQAPPRIIRRRWRLLPPGTYRPSRSPPSPSRPASSYRPAMQMSSDSEVMSSSFMGDAAGATSTDEEGPGPQAAAGRREGGAREAAMALFDIIDSNGDGVITRPELEAAQANGAVPDFMRLRAS